MAGLVNILGIGAGALTDLFLTETPAGQKILDNIKKQFQDATSSAPTPPSIESGYNTYPSDLLTNSKFYTQIDFMAYGSSTAYSFDSNAGSQQFTSTGSGMVLPIPRKINDHQTVVWDQVSATNIGINVGADVLAGVLGSTRGLFGEIAAVDLVNATKHLAGDVGGLVGSLNGKAINPYLVLLFKTPGFKKHVLSWIFAPNNQKESQTVADIIHAFKFNMLPSKAGTFLYNYPNLAVIQLFPEPFYTLHFQPCAILDVQVDYTAGGSPSFHKGGAPTIISLTVFLEEVVLWTQDNFPAGDKASFGG